MKELINISGQKFYYSTINQVIERCSQKEKCAIIIDENYLDELIINGRKIIGECVNQIIIIGGDVDMALSQLKGVSVLLISSESLHEAVRIAIFGAELNKEVICISEKEESVVGNVIDEIVG